MRKSLSRTAALGSKAQEMLGLNPSSNKSRVLQVQRQGFLHKKPFNVRGIHGNWQRRYFVLKDSFLFWYDRKPSTSFDMRPNGCLPLGGCSVFPMGKERDGGFVFEVSHPDFNGNVLRLKSKDKAEVDDWIRVLQDCSKATWQNAMLGDALIQKLKHAGTAAEREREEALQEARRNAEEMAKAREAKMANMERQLSEQRRFEAELQAEKQRAQALEGDLQAKDEQLARERREQEEEEARTSELERKLKEAYKAIEQLEKAVERRQRTDLPGMTPNPELQEHIAVIRNFMEGRNANQEAADENNDPEDDDDEEEFRPEAYDDED